MELMRNSQYITKEEMDAVRPDYLKTLQSPSDKQQRIMDSFRLTDAFRRSFGEYLFSENPNRESIRIAVKNIREFGHVEDVDMDFYHDMIVDMLYTKFVLGFYYKEYFLFDFEHTPIVDRLEFLSATQRDHYFSILNNNIEYNHILDDKIRAYRLFKPYYGREVISCDGTNFREFAAFAENHPKFLLKPDADYGGHGITWIERESGKDLRALYDSLVEKYNRFVCEEPVIAADYMAKIYPHCINTVRVLTYYNEPAEPVIVASFMRVGQKGSCADNFTSGGIASEVDIKTGVVYTDGVDRVSNRYEVQPDTGIPFKGFRIRNWGEAVSLAKKLHRLVPQVRLVGWDLAASQKGWQVIEANAHPLVQVHEYTRPQGIRRMFEEVTEWKKHGI